MTPNALIARALRRERQHAGLSLSALAARAGLAKSTLSQLEAGQGNPSVETLWALATALGVPFSQLFQSPNPEAALIRAGEGTPLSAQATPFAATLLAAGGPGRRRDLYRLDLAGAARRQAEPHPAGTVEHAVVCQGRVRLGPLEALEELARGDYYRYAADRVHLYQGLSDDSVVLLVMESPA
ncbi:helix-turn-helix domain-containing protein [Roseospirillum parvum]|uniref:Helix-turn-helix n=1 Tax=Roseospirillum parvum TaxID=83401 RepID=A0A1G7XTC9_9PROT|nr:XRE family transcriptional regulator [Roseospirillum parvum]SDG87356.1 Helix-turn-helix [Roseospirillum parvum]